MDLSACLFEIRTLTGLLLMNADLDDPADLSHDALRLAELIDALDGQITRYGRFPSLWERSALLTA